MAPSPRKRFFTPKHIILQHWLPKQRTISGEYCTQTLQSALRNAIREGGHRVFDKTMVFA
jgi:hypothetical protein